jgi:hypothetical protein
MLRLILTTILAALVLSCSGHRPNGFEIIDSYGEVYTSNHISNRLGKEYGLEKNPKMLLLLTDSLDRTTFGDQLNILSRVNAETYQYIYVIGCSTDRDESGYSLSSEDAAAMLSENQFQIRIYDEFGKITYSSTRVLSELEIKNHLTKSSSRR